MTGTISIALGAVFLALASVYHGQSKKPETENPQNSRFAALMFAIGGAGFLVAAAISFLKAD